MYRLISILFFSFILIIPFFLYENVALGQTQEVRVIVFPEHPKANENVTITLESSDYNLSSADINWVLNGASERKGTGIKEFTFLSGSLGSTQIVNVSINPLNEPNSFNRASFQKRIVIRPSEVDLIWQAASYIPNFYKGKALYAPQGEILIVAIPHIINSSKIKIGSENLLYTWRENGTVIPEISGYGRNVFPFLSPVVSQTKTISVTVSTVDESYIAQNSIVVSPVEPEIHIYENHPLYGILSNREITGTHRISGQEASFLAVPYYFSSERRKDNDLEYSWDMNRVVFSDQSSRDLVTFRKTASSEGTSNISVSIEHARKLLQSAASDFSINLGN